jgi:hypothetical protein
MRADICLPLVRARHSWRSALGDGRGRNAMDRANGRCGSAGATRSQEPAFDLAGNIVLLDRQAPGQQIEQALALR